MSRSRKSWTEQEVEYLKAMREMGESVARIAQVVGRSQGTVQAKLKKLGLTRKYENHWPAGASAMGYQLYSEGLSRKAVIKSLIELYGVTRNAAAQIYLASQRRYRREKTKTSSYRKDFYERNFGDTPMLHSTSKS